MCYRYSATQCKSKEEVTRCVLLCGAVRQHNTIVTGSELLCVAVVRQHTVKNKEEVTQSVFSCVAVIRQHSVEKKRGSHYECTFI